MRVGLVLDRFDVSGGGLGRWTVGFAEFLVGRGHAVDVLAFASAASSVVRMHELAPRRGLLARARAVEACLAGLRLDVVLDTGTSWSGDVFLPCTGSRRLSQRRLVATHPALKRLRAAVSPRSRLLDWSLGRLEREQVRRAKQVIAVSSKVRDVLYAQHGLAGDRVVVIPNGVDTSRFAPERMSALRSQVRARLDVGASTVFVGSAHNLPLKGMDTAIRALPDDAVLLIAGGLPDPAWAKLAASKGGRVRFLGLVDDMALLLAAADALVHPTRWDACSLSTIEAGAAGLPAITTVPNGAAELIRDGETGFVLPDPEDVGALAERMRRLLDPAVRSRMGAAALAASAGHDVQANYRAVEAVLAANSRAGSVRGPVA